MRKNKRAAWCTFPLDDTSEFKFALLSDSEEDFDFSLAVRNAAMRPHLTLRWPWDDAWQERLHRRRFEVEPFAAISNMNRRVGTVCLERLPDYWLLSEFYLFPEFQRRGIGSKILRLACAAADREKQPIRLHCLLWNPAGELYRRFGFREIGRTDINAIMERSPGAIEPFSAHSSS
jgi:GNAT superfamily N-acetyltransferase